VLLELEDSPTPIVAVLNKHALLSDPPSARAQLLSPEGAVILVNKPYGETSFFVVSVLRRLLRPHVDVKRAKVGHAGTLDPLATGLLILATRGCTKLLGTLTEMNKSYRIRIRLGLISPSYDLETPIEVVTNTIDISREQIESELQSLLGFQDQMPPIYSAIKQQGKPVYLKARKGEAVTMQTRRIFVEKAELLSVDLPFVEFRIVCSKGTYVRSLVHDLGEQFGTGAVLTDLERDAIGAWRVVDAVQIDDLKTLLAI
jgi:tRNA pseudouridine55 synthase